MRGMAAQCASSYSPYNQVLEGWLTALRLLQHPISPRPWLGVKKITNSDFNLKQTRENNTDKRPSVRFSASWPKSPQCCNVQCNAPAPRELPSSVSAPSAAPHRRRHIASVFAVKAHSFQRVFICHILSCMYITPQRTSLKLRVSTAAACQWKLVLCLAWWQVLK